MSTNSIRTSCDDLIDLILEWKGKGLRFHLRIKNNRPEFWFSEIPEQIQDKVRKLYAESVDEIVKRFTPPSDEKVAVEFNGGDFFSALQAAAQTTVVDYELVKSLDSKEKPFDPPWRWKPCESKETKVPCEMNGTCLGNLYWEAKRDKKRILTGDVRQCPFLWKLDRWWEHECRGWNIKPVMHEGRMQFLIDGETFWQFSARRKNEIAEEVADVLRNRPQQEESPLELGEAEFGFVDFGHGEEFTADTSAHDYSPLEDV